MEINRVPQQQPETLDEFYSNLANDEDPAWKACGNMMLALINHLRDAVPGPPLRASTAHVDLILVEPNERKRAICTAWSGRYKIACSARPEDALWRNAHVVGYTESVIDAGNMIVKALSYAPKE